MRGRKEKKTERNINQTAIDRNREINRHIDRKKKRDRLTEKGKDRQ